MQVLKFLNILKEQKAESYHYLKKKFDTTFFNIGAKLDIQKILSKIILDIWSGIQEPLEVTRYSETIFLQTI